MMRTLGFLALLSVLLPLNTPAQTTASSDTKPVRVAIVGLVHGHVDGFFRSAKNRKEIEIVGIFEPDTEIQRSYARKYGFSDSMFFTDLGQMLDRTRPEAVAAFTSTFDHAMAVEACARRHVHLMMEKPLAVNMAHARAIQRAAESGGIHVIVNYETTWYQSHAAMWDLFKERRAAGDIRKMVAMDGHQGPKEIRVQPEFLAWLSDPAKNGAGALFDFGCYGANLMTWLMDNQPPLAVTAMTQCIKPQTYPRVDDQATVLLEYPKAQGIIQASWNWPVNRKDFEVYGERGYAIATGGNSLRVRLAGQQTEEMPALAPLAPEEHDSIAYLAAVVRGKRKPSGLSSLENNVIVTQILEAARESARTGKRVTIAPR